MNYICEAPNNGAVISPVPESSRRAEANELLWHGAIGQNGITKAELRPYCQLVAKILGERAQSPLRTHLESSWARIALQASETIAASSCGAPVSWDEKDAANDILTINDRVNITNVFEIALAIYIMRDQQPERFKGDAAFRVQLARRIRGLTSLNYYTFANPSTGEEVSLFKQTNPEALVILGDWLANAFGAFGLHFAKVERRKQDMEQRELGRFLLTLATEL